MLNLVLWIFFGALAGWIASMIVGKNAQMGALANIIVGIVGAIIGGFVLNAFGFSGVTGFNVTSLIVSILGAVVLLFLVGLVRRGGDRAGVSTRKVQSSGFAEHQPKRETPVKAAPASTDRQSPAISPARKPASPSVEPPKKTGRVPTYTTSETKPGVIFLSYRREDSSHVAGRIYDELIENFGPVSVFKDVDSIPLGLDFKKILDAKVSECDVFLVIIGDQWLDLKDSHGRRRLDNPADFVRIEIESALRRDIPVIPLLVGRAPMPAQEELPASLRDLAYRNGIPVRPDPDFHRDMDRLISALKPYIQPDT